MRQAFSLVELLAVIAILGIVAVITTTVVLSSGESSKEELYKSQKEIVIEAAKKWAIENDYKIDPSYNVTLEELYNNGFLGSKTITDPRNKKNQLCGPVTISYQATNAETNEKTNKYIYTYNPSSRPTCN